MQLLTETVWRLLPHASLAQYVNLWANSKGENSAIQDLGKPVYWHCYKEKNNFVSFTTGLKNYQDDFIPVSKFHAILLRINYFIFRIVTENFFLLARYSKVMSKLWICLQFDAFASFQTF